jgi:hypothetical protein
MSASGLGQADKPRVVNAIFYGFCAAAITLTSVAGTSWSLNWPRAEERRGGAGPVSGPRRRCPYESLPGQAFETVMPLGVV